MPRNDAKVVSSATLADVQLPSTISLTPCEILQSVKSLYADELKAYGRVLLKRLRERAAQTAAELQGLSMDAVDPEIMPRIDPRRLRKACESCTLLSVEPEEGKEYSVKLVGQENSFFDICSPDDPYSSEFWEEVCSYLDDLSKDSMMLPGGRYACARVLVRRNLPFLTGLSLGQVCHFVQLAISQKKLLGYLDGSLVPYRYSEGWIKEQCALNNQCTAGAGSLPLASWEEVHTYLRELLDAEVNPAPGMMTISNVKRLFRSRFQLELSETVFGYTKLFDLLSDPFFHDVCSLHVRGNGQVVVKRVRKVPATPPGVWGPFPMMLPFPMMQHHDSVSTEASSLDMNTQWALVSPGASPRGASTPSDAASPLKSTFSFDEISTASWDSSSCRGDDVEVSSESTPQALHDVMNSIEDETSSHGRVSVKNTFIEIQTQEPEPVMPKVGARQRSSSIPRNMWSCRESKASSVLHAQAASSPRAACLTLRQELNTSLTKVRKEDHERTSNSQLQKLQQQQQPLADFAFGCDASWGADWNCSDWCSSSCWLQNQSSTFQDPTCFYVGPPGVWFPSPDRYQEPWVPPASSENMELGDMSLAQDHLQW